MSIQPISGGGNERARMFVAPSSEEPMQVAQTDPPPPSPPTRMEGTSLPSTDVNTSDVPPVIIEYNMFGHTRTISVAGQSAQVPATEHALGGDAPPDRSGQMRILTPTIDLKA